MTATASSTSLTCTPAEQPERRIQTRTVATVAVVLGAVLLALATAVHLSASSGYERSFSASVSLEQRTTTAAFAHQLEPWNQRFATRAIVMQKWLRGSVLLSQGADLPAMLELSDAYRLDVGDKQLLALFKISQDELTLHSNFKAHVQHAHEGPGGTLRPQDLLR